MDIITFKYDDKKGRGLIKTPFLNEIRENFSQLNDTYEIQKKRGGYAPKRYYAITKSGRFSIGLFSLIYKFCKKEYPDAKIKIDSELSEKCFPSLSHLNIKQPKCDISLREYQLESIQRAFKQGRGIIKVGTGGGKSFIIACILESLFSNNREFMAVIIVPNLGLVNQMYDDFKTYGVSFTYSKWTGSVELEKNINVVIVNSSNFVSKYSPKISKEEIEIYKTISSLNKDEIKEFYNKENDFVSLLKTIFRQKKKNFIKEENTYKCLVDIKNKLDKCYEYFDIIDNKFQFSDCVIVDECHGINNNSKISEIVDNFVTQNRFGFTGTTSKNDMDYWRSVGILGPVIYSKKSKELREGGFISQAKINVIKMHHKNLPRYERNRESTYNYNLELEYCYNSKSRNSIIKNIISKTQKNSLIIVERIEQGEILFSLLKTIKNKKVYYITGEMEVKERDRIKEEMENNDNVICIAISKIFSVGISIKNIHYLFFVTMGKSFIKVIQSIGRGLRKHESKNKLIIFDICDNLIYSNKHLNERLNYYEEENFDFTVKEFFER